MLYALAVHDAIQKGDNFSDGRTLVKYMTNRSFEGLICLQFDNMYIKKTLLSSDWLGEMQIKESSR